LAQEGFGCFNSLTTDQGNLRNTTTPFYEEVRTDRPCFVSVCMPQKSGSGQNFTWVERFLGHRCCRHGSLILEVGDTVVLNRTDGDPCLKLDVTCTLDKSKPFSPPTISVKPRRTNSCCHFNGVNIQPGGQALIPKKCSIVQCQEAEGSLEVIVSQVYDSCDCCLFQDQLGLML
jgi:hypothetical protein